MTSEKRKDELRKTKEKLNNPGLSLLEVEKLSNEILVIYANNPVRSLEEITKEEFFLGDEVGSKIYKKYSEFIDQWNKGEKSPDEKELKFLEKVCQLIPTMFAQERQREEALNQLKHLNEDDKQKLIVSTKKNQETLKKYQPILKQLIKQERERERERKKKIQLILQRKRANKLSLQLLSPLKLPLLVQAKARRMEHLGRWLFQ